MKRRCNEARGEQRAWDQEARTREGEQLSKPSPFTEHLAGHNENSVFLIYVVEPCKDKMIMYAEFLYLADLLAR